MTATDFPATDCAITVCIALPNGSKIAATSCGICGADLPNIARGKAEVIREASIAVDADDGHLAADMPLTRPAEEAMAAADVSFS